MKKLKFVGAVLVPVLLMSFASTVGANGNPDKTLPLPIPTIKTGKVKSQGLDQQAGDVRWILPGPRRLDPAVFGTPAAPLGFEPDVGVPLAMRLTTPDGSAYTTTAMPTPFSDNAAIISGHYDLVAEDNTLVDDPASKDVVNYRATVTSPAGDRIEIEVSQVLPVGVDHAVFGGVGTNMIHHGMTGIGTKMQPTQPTVAAFWDIVPEAEGLQEVRAALEGDLPVPEWVARHLVGDTWYLFGNTLEGDIDAVQCEDVEPDIYEIIRKCVVDLARKIGRGNEALDAKRL